MSCSLESNYPVFITLSEEEQRFCLQSERTIPFGKLSDGAGVLLLYSNTLQNKEKQHLLNGREEDMGSCDKISLWDLNVSLLGGYESGFALLIFNRKSSIVKYADRL